MGLNHRDFILATFGREIHLFNEICYNRDEPVLDIHEAIPDWRANQLAAQTYAASVIDYIWDAMPTFFEKVERILRQGGQ
jgi:hypothetical protein